jgi:hypothetical protein
MNVINQQIINNNMNKITKLFAVLVFASTFSVAANAQTSNKNFVGPSIEVGFSNTTMNTDNPNGYGVFQESTKSRPRIALNYGVAVQNNFVVGLGISRLLGNSSDYSDFYNDDELMKYQSETSIYVAPTYLINDSTGVYAKLSYNRVNASYFYDAGYDEVATKTLSGYGYGLGIKSFISKDFYLLAEVEKVDYGTSDFDGYDIKSKATNATVSLGVKF